MAIFDISLAISDSTVVWPGDTPVHITQPLHLDRGDTATVSRLDMGSHTGTHVDAPAHFISGARTVDVLDLGLLVGPAFVTHALETDVLSEDVLEELLIPTGVERVLFRTRNSERWARGDREFHEDYVAISEGGARWLVARGVRLVGVDYLSVASFSEPVGTHEILLRASIVAVEGLNLYGIDQGPYHLVCLPLRIAGGDGAPARAILMNEESVQQNF